MDENRGSPGGHVLIVDDDDDIRATLSEVLALEGYTSDVATDGASALERLRQRPASLVILDLMMPGMNGWDFRKNQLKDPELAQIPVAVLSGAGIARARLGELGAVAYLQKPVSLEGLIEVASRYCCKPRGESIARSDA